MTIDDKRRDEKLQYDTSMAVAKIPILSSGKTKKYEYLSREYILTPQQDRLIEEVILTYSPLGRNWKNKQKQLRRREKNKSKL